MYLQDPREKMLCLRVMKVDSEKDLGIKLFRGMISGLWRVTWGAR